MMVMVHVRPVGVMPVVVVMPVMPMFQSPANKPALPTFQKTNEQPRNDTVCLIKDSIFFPVGS